MRQYSYSFQPTSNQQQVYRFSAHPFLRPEEFLSVVAVGDEIKLHALVDEGQPAVIYQVLIVGTGQQIDDSLLEHLYKVGVVELHGRYGYHVYFLGDARELPGATEERVAQFELRMEWKDDVCEQAGFDYVNLNAHIDRFYAEHADVCELLIGEDEQYLSLVFFDENFRQHPDFSALMLAVCASTAVQEFSLVIGDEIGL